MRRVRAKEFERTAGRVKAAVDMAGSLELSDLCSVVLRDSRERVLITSCW
jgi:hypothetical protein